MFNFVPYRHDKSRRIYYAAEDLWVTNATNAIVDTGVKQTMVFYHDANGQYFVRERAEFLAKFTRVGTSLELQNWNALKDETPPLDRKILVHDDKGEVYLTWWDTDLKGWSLPDSIIGPPEWTHWTEFVGPEKK